MLDIAKRSDDSRVRTGHADHNASVLRHIALNLLGTARKRQKWVSKPSGLKLVGITSTFLKF